MTDAHPYRAGLPDRPDRIASLPVDERGYPVPAFVATIDGKPDHRIIERQFMPRAVKFNLCWTCGQPLGTFKSFIVGPMCTITRVSAEPPSHLDCARYAVQACPFMTKPNMRRRDAGLPDDTATPGGLMIMRNPGCMCIWTTRSFKPFRTTASDGAPSLLFDMGEPTGMTWHREGRAATREEIMESIAGGLPNLQALAEKDGPKAVLRLGMETGKLTNLLDHFGPRYAGDVP